MRHKALIVLGAFAAFALLQACSSSPEQGLLKRYFNAVQLKDNATMSAIAIEPIEIEAQSWQIVGEAEEQTEPASLPQLNTTEAELKKQLEQHVGPTIDSKDAMDVAQDDVDSARTSAARNAARKKLEEATAAYEKERTLHDDLQQKYNEAKAAAALEEQIASFSLGDRNIANVRDLTGTVSKKQAELKVVTPGGGERRYRVHMRQYALRDETANLSRNGRWIIVRFEPLS